ncbi:SPOR domain-containing protein [Thiohalobacter sp. IOR34]|uniref:SPOR domain-containing protein n=1 Tax=Thiohalobacter sp. IOR34 TaxID=3057176 RepID=UPI0025AF12FE|nr:SPOR domain-containing protein [Thiohalobacter sp. IOR34]WJW74511.1 SPOR domain-containing protein [Thiohalobacter sp. IOR34]
MDKQLKQRLVGATVLVALAVILVPMFLDGRRDMGTLGSNLPPPPPEVVRDRAEPLILPPPVMESPQHRVVETPEEEAPGQQQTTPAPAASGDEAAAPEAAQTPAPPARVQTSQPADPRLTGWVVQLASFSKQANALALRDRLRAKGYASFVERAETPKGILYRVRVGPELQRENAQRLLRRIEKEFKLKGLVSRYPG